MKFKLSEIETRIAGLVSLGKLRLPAKLNYAVNYNLEKLEQERDRATKERIRLCERYANKDGEGKPITVEREIEGRTLSEYDIPDTEKVKFSEELEELLNTEVDIDIRTVKMELVEKCEEAEQFDNPNVAHMRAMYFMIEE